MSTNTDNQYEIGYIVLPDTSITSGNFAFSETPSQGAVIQFTCTLDDANGNKIQSLTASSSEVTSTPIDISSLPGSSLTLKLNFENSGQPDTEIPLDLSSKGGLSALSQMVIAVTWHAVDDPSANAALIARRNATTPTRSYLTGFDDHGIYGFLSYIPWIASHWVQAQPPTQNSTKALSGSYSCQFNEGLLGQSYIDTIDLAVPSGSTHVVFSFAFTMLMGGQFPSLYHLMTLDVYENGTKKQSYNVGLMNNTEINGWYNEEFTYELSSGSVSNVKMVLSLEATGHLGGILTVDNLSINFIKNAPAAQETLLVYGDTDGNIFGLDRYTGNQLWSFKSEYGFLSSTVLIQHGIAYFGDGNTQANIYALNAQDGTQIWKTPLQGSIDATPVISGNLLIVGSSNGYLYAIDKSNGSISWSLDFYNSLNSKRSTANAVSDYVNGMTSDNHGKVYLSTTDGIYAMNVTSEQSLWYHASSQAVPFAPVLTEEEVIYGDKSGHVFALDKSTGAKKWDYYSSSPINSLPYLVGGVVVFGNDGGELFGLKATDGTLIWTKSFSSGTMIRSFTIDGPYIFVSANDVGGKCYCLSYSIDDQAQWHISEKWSSDLPLGAQCPPAVADDMVFYSASNLELYALEKAGGTRIWDFNSGKLGFATPAIMPPKPIPSLSRRYDQYCYLVAHNAYANIDDGWWYAQQSHTIIEQLDMGARGLELDIFFQDINGTQEIVYNHEGLANIFMYLWAKWKLLKDSLSEIKNWMDNNPDQIITIIFEQGPGLGNPNTSLTQAFRDSGTADYVFYANKTNTGSTGATWNVSTQGWPTLQWLVDNDKRLVVFSQKNKGNTNGFANLWDYAVENEYGTPSILSGCEKRSESDPLSSNTNKLFVVNYALNIPTSPTTIVSPSTYTLTNNYFWLLAKLRMCQDASGNSRLPNLVKVNFFEYGSVGGPLRVVQEINNEWAQVS